MGQPLRTKFKSIAFGLLGATAAIFGVLYLEDFSWPLRQLVSQSAIRGFDRVPMMEASPEQLDAAHHWRAAESSEPHPADGGEVVLSLTPADPQKSPTIWNVTRNQVAGVARPPATSLVTRTSGRVVALGRFHGGLAPAAVDFDPLEPLVDDKAAPATTNAGVPPLPRMVRWGYVDPAGQWVIPPHYLEAGAFVGDVAVVLVDAGSFRLIDRTGKELPWGRQPLVQNYEKPTLRHVRLVPLGRWVWIDHRPAWSADGRGFGRGETTVLARGTQLIAVPGVNAQASEDGELWLLSTDQGFRLWKPEGGFVALPAGVVPLKPVAGDIFLGHSLTSQSTALLSIDGRVRVDPAPVFKVLRANRFIACQSGASESLFKWTEGSRNLGPDLPGHRCGVLDEQGRWWAPPVHQIVAPWGEHKLHLQVGGRACLADLRLAKAPDCLAGGASEAPVPLLEATAADGWSRAYAYQNADASLATPHRFTQAFPFVGQLAQVSDEAGFPGLIDRTGHWRTPHIVGGPVEVAHRRAAILQAPHRNKAPSGSGLIDRRGRWVLPPVFSHLQPYADGSWLACPHRLGVGAGGCGRIDVSGQALPPIKESSVDSASLPPATVASDNPAADPNAPATASPMVAVASNGRWGFQDAEGRWLIEPRFEDAQDFSGDVASAAIFKTVPRDDEERRQEKIRSGATIRDANSDDTQQELRWGLIDRRGEWLVAPMFESVEGFHRGVALARENGLLGLVDRVGNWLAAAEFSSIGLFEGEVATATRPDGRQCRLHLDGRCRGEFMETVGGGAGGLEVARQVKADRNGLFGYLDAAGEWAIPPTFSQAQPFVGEYAVATSSLPPLTEAERRLWIPVQVQTFERARAFAIKAEHAAATKADEARLAIADADGHWLIPQSPRWWVGGWWPFGGARR